MKNNNILKEIKAIEQLYGRLNSKLKKSKLLKSKNDIHTNEEVDDFLTLWGEYIKFYRKLRSLIRKSHYRSFFFNINYTKLVTKRYLLIMYFNSLVDLLNHFGKQEEYIRVLLDESFSYDYGKVARYIYYPSHINLLNTPTIYLSIYKNFINPKFHYMLNTKRSNLGKDMRILTDYRNIYYYVKYRLDKVLFFLSKYICKIISNSRITNRKFGLIQKRNLKKYLEISKPGDIFLTRGNWNVSNAPIPGFWKHMSMFLGSGKFLKKNYGKTFKFINKLKDETNYVIEATGEGVNILSIGKFIGHNDYLGVSRTSFKDEKILRAIKSSLERVGIGYDHLFNFYSNKSVVCSELIIKSYSKEYEKDEGIEVSLEKVGMGLTFPPNNLVKLMYNESKKDNPIIKPVFFIDSKERTGANFVSTHKRFLDSRKRSRLSFFLK